MTDYRIYVASLSDYNNGRLHGVWIDCDGKDTDDLQYEVNALLRSSAYPNVMVECPTCEGTGAHEPATGYVNSGNLAIRCQTCNESGEVPSAEEYAIHDHEGFGDLIGEYTGLAAVADIVDALESASDPQALLEFAELLGVSPADCTGDFEDNFCGQWNSEQEFAENLLDEIGELDDDSLASRYFDYESFARDLFMCDYVRTDSGYVFHNC